MGFFNLGPPPAAETKQAKSSGGCDACGLQKTNYEEFSGPADAEVLFVLDYPCIERGEDPNQTNIKYRPSHALICQWQSMGELPDGFLDRCAFTNAVPCSCSRQDLTSKRARCCEGRLHSLIKRMKPKVVIPLGIIATQALISGRLTGRISNVRATEFYGKCIPDRYFNAWICPTYDVAFVRSLTERFRPDVVPARQMLTHIKAAINHIDMAFPVIPQDIRTTLDPQKAARMIRNGIADALKHSAEPVIAIDYETTGIKPHGANQEIVVGSMAWEGVNGIHAIGFWWDKDCPELIDAWHELYRPGTPVKLIAHKADFETCWTHFKAGLHGTITDWPTNWDWDTCLGAHVLDNNQKVGLKFHAYTELGILGYDDGADPYLSGTMPGEDPDSCNSRNLLAMTERVPKLNICDYCAQDSLYSLLLRAIQKMQMEAQEYTVGRSFDNGISLESPTLLEFFKFFLEGMVTLSKVQSGGLPIDISQVDNLKQQLEDKKKAAIRAIANSEEGKLYAQHTGELFNASSPTQLATLLYDVLKIKPPSGVRDTSVGTLEGIDLPIVQDILTMRHYSKMGDTFLKNYSREAVWDEPTQSYLIRPFFNLSTGSGGEAGGPRTYRSSADSPNFQNIPKRDKEMKHLLRSLFIAPPGWKYMEADYKSLEVMVSASYHHDPSMVKYLCDPTSDMHRDTAADMYIRAHDQVSKAERQSIKMGYVFSSFYGAVYKTCAERMWAKMPAETKAHLAADCGIKTYAQWEKHVKEADDIFWHQRFKVYGQWREDEWDRYQKHGFVEGYMGCRCYGPMSFTECANRCIQGSGFHTLLQALGDDVRDFERLGLQSRIIGQIHDAIVLLVKSEEQELVEDILYKNGVIKVMHNFKWITVPLVIEAEVSEDGGSWASMGGEHALKFSPNAATNGAFAPGEPNWVEIDKNISAEVLQRCA